MLLGFLYWLLLIPAMITGTANCGDESMDQTIYDFTLMNTLAFTSLGGLVMGLLLPSRSGSGRSFEGKMWRGR